MSLHILVFALAAAAQAAPPSPGGPPSQRLMGRSFISPMGEPFRVGTTSDEGLAAWFRQADANHDGFVTSDEMKADAKRFFLTLDTNHDGEIDPEEINRYENEVAPEVRSGRSWGGVTGSDRVNDEATGGGGLGLLSIPEPVAAADSNFNRGVSEMEFEQAAAKRFRLLDTSGTGRLTLPALQAQREAVRSFARKPLPKKPSSDDSSSSSTQSQQ